MFSNVSDTLKTLFHGAIGGVTLGIYHKIQTDKTIQTNNQLLDTKLANRIEDRDKEIKQMIRELLDIKSGETLPGFHTK
jgi:flagellar basal body-associated protein FliL